MENDKYRSAGVYVAALLLTLVGGSMFNILPLLTAGAVDTLGFSDSQAGIFSSFITVGSGLSAVFAVTWIRSVRWPRATVLALGGFLASNLAAMVAHNYWVFVLLEGVAGAFAAAVVCLGVTILSDREESERAFGLANALQVVYQISVFLMGPTLLRLGGLNGVLALLAAVSVLGMCLATLLPPRGRDTVTEQVSRNLLKPATLLALGGFAAFFVSAGAYWTYVQIMGEASGMASQLTANCVAVGVSAGLVGGIGAWALGDRFGKLPPLWFSTLLVVGASVLLHGSFGATTFTLSVVFYFGAWNYAVAYQLSIVNAVDTTGRGIAITQACAFFGAAGGAGLAAFFVGPGRYEPVIWIAVISACVSTVLFAAALVVHRRLKAALSGELPPAALGR